jgi:hypothetical protein
MPSTNEITEIFYLSDEFSRGFDFVTKKHHLQNGDDRKHRNKPNRLSDSEVMTISSEA